MQYEQIDFDTIFKAFKRCLIVNGNDEYNFVEKDAEEDKNQAELESLDDYLLLD